MYNIGNLHIYEFEKYFIVNRFVFDADYNH